MNHLDYFNNLQKSKVAILLHDGLLDYSGKTGISLLRYSEAEIVVVIDRQTPGKSVSELTKIARSMVGEPCTELVLSEVEGRSRSVSRTIPIVASVQECLAYGPDVLVLGIAPSGGILPSDWYEEIKLAIVSGLSIVNGLHILLSQDQELTKLMKREQWLWDVRQEPGNLSIASAQAKKLNCRRVLTVGTDMAIGKMSTSIELTKLAKNRGLKAEFIATGQTGLMLYGKGVALDAVRVDFAAGAVEKAVLECGINHGSTNTSTFTLSEVEGNTSTSPFDFAQDKLSARLTNQDIIFIEGQGSLLHPGSTATLPLLRGSQPTHLILVHKAGQVHIKRHPDVLIPPLNDVIKLYETVASAAGAFHPAKVSGIALNTYDLGELEARQAIDLIQRETGLPCTDPIRFSCDILLDAILI